VPAVSTAQLMENIGKGKPVAAIVLMGSDPYLRDLIRAKLRETYVPDGAQDWAIARIPASDGMEEVVQRAQTLPMLSPRQLLYVEEVERIERLGEKARDAAVDALEQYLSDPAPFTILVLESEKLDNRQRLAKMLTAKALIVSLEVSREDALALTELMAKELGSVIDRDAATTLVEILNGEPARIRTELEKLSLYTLEKRRITSADVDLLVISAEKQTVWQLADMLASRQRDAAMRFLDSLLREGEQPAGIVGALAWMYRKLIEARELPAGTNGFAAARALQMRPQSADMALRQSRQMKAPALRLGLQALAEADSDLKSGIANPRAVMEFLIARLTV
jgi:DNA polymerase-3 subunit delta